MAVRGTTPEARAAARLKKSAERRAQYYVSLMHKARWEQQSPKETLRHACEFLRAVATDLPPATVFEIAEQITRIADERNGR
jgi:hypothetical protein